MIHAPHGQFGEVATARCHCEVARHVYVERCWNVGVILHPLTLELQAFLRGRRLLVQRQPVPRTKRATDRLKFVNIEPLRPQRQAAIDGRQADDLPLLAAVFRVVQ